MLSHYLLFFKWGTTYYNFMTFFPGWLHSVSLLLSKRLTYSQEKFLKDLTQNTLHFCLQCEWRSRGFSMYVACEKGKNRSQKAAAVAAHWLLVFKDSLEVVACMKFAIDTNNQFLQENYWCKLYMLLMPVVLVLGIGRSSEWHITQIVVLCLVIVDDAWRKSIQMVTEM